MSLPSSFKSVQKLHLFHETYVSFWQLVFEKKQVKVPKKNILAINIRLESRRAELRLAVRVQDTSKAHMGSQLLWGSVPHQQGLKCSKAPSSNLERPGDTDTGQTARL